MAPIARKPQGTVQDRIRTFVAEHAEAIEPGLTVLETSLRLGRTTIDVVALDAKQTLVLVVAGEVADQRMLINTLDAYIWCLAFPDNVRRLYPNASIVVTRPPRVIVVAESIPDAFLELAEGLSVVHVECQELAGPDAAAPDREKDRAPAAIAEPTFPAGTATPAAPGPERHVPAAPLLPVAPVAPVTPVMPAPLAPVSVTAEAPMTAAPVMPMPAAPAPAPRWPANARPAEAKKVSAGFDAQVAQQWNLEEQSEEAWTEANPGSAPATHGVSANGHAASDGPTPATNGRAPSAPAASPQPGRSEVFAQALRDAEASIEHNPIGLGRPRVVEPAAAPVQPVVAPVQPASGPAKPGGPPAKPAPVAPAPGESHESRAMNHPALEALCFPKGGLSRQWQEFLDQLAATP